MLGVLHRSLVIRSSAAVRQIRSFMWLRVPILKTFALAPRNRPALHDRRLHVVLECEVLPKPNGCGDEILSPAMATSLNCGEAGLLNIKKNIQGQFRCWPVTTDIESTQVARQLLLRSRGTPPQWVASEDPE